MQAIIMAGGKGTRIASISNEVPKPMIMLCGKPILQYQIECLKKNGITDITLVIGYLGHVIRDYFGDGNSFEVTIHYFEEVTPLGTAGALYKIPNLNEDFLLLCGDTIFDIDFERLIKFHNEHKALATLASHPNSHPYDSSLLVTEILAPIQDGGLPTDSKKVIKWLNKEDDRSDKFYKNRVNAGIEVISPELLSVAKKKLNSEKVDLDRDILKPHVFSGRIFAYDTPEYIKDMGTPDRYYQTEKDLITNLVNKRNLENKQKAIFLDRDGTLNKDVGFLREIDQMELISGVAEAINLINASGYLAIIITNQPVIARGEVSFELLQKIHNKLETLLGAKGAYIDGLFFCPHHPHQGFEGERLEYKYECSCRKPRPGMLFEAAEKYNIDLSKSYMVGDSDVDLEAGKAAGCTSIKISSEYSLYDFVQEYI